MEALHLPDNIKVHFAGAEVMNQFIVCKELGVDYALFTAYPFVERMVFDKPKSPIMPLKWMQNPAIDIPTFVQQNNRHVIQDSGLFTLMFGSQKNITKDEALVNKWYENLVQFTLNHGQPVTCVEVDCQKVLGVEKAWEFRERMRRDLPNNRIINVFHLEDGIKGLDRLIEFSEYIAISVPELRFAGKANWTGKIARYIKHKKPTIDIHLLGCTSKSILKENTFCTSCDSTTYVAPIRFGFLGGRHIRNINTKSVIEYFGQEHFDNILQYNNEQHTCALLLAVEHYRQMYQEVCGNQDYKTPIK